MISTGNCLPGISIIGAAGCDKNSAILFEFIVADIIMELNKSVGEFMEENGVYITGGIIEAREDEVLLSFAENGFKVIERFEEKGWLVFVLKKAS